MSNDLLWLLFKGHVWTYIWGQPLKKVWFNPTKLHKEEEKVKWHQFFFGRNAFWGSLLSKYRILNILSSQSKMWKPSLTWFSIIGLIVGVLLPNSQTESQKFWTKNFPLKEVQRIRLGYYKGHSTRPFLPIPTKFYVA